MFPIYYWLPLYNIGAVRLALNTIIILLVSICFNSVTNKRYIDSKKRDLLRYTVFYKEVFVLEVFEILLIR